MFYKRLLIVLSLLTVSQLFAQNDCTDAIVVCGNAESDGLTVNGIGTQELNGLVTCGSQENNSIWLKLNINSGGTLSFTLKPKSNSINEDFDFFIFGPTTNCNNLGTSIRCSTTNPLASGQSNNHTGLNSSETDVNEGPGELGNSFLRELNVLAGESYYLVIDRPIGNSAFNIEWGGTASFNPPPSFQVPAGTALNIEECDNDGLVDQRTPFNLSANDAVIIGTQTNVTVTYYTSSNDAIIGQNQIPNPGNFRNTQNPQILFARITDTSNQCYDYTTFTISVADFISFPITEYSVCDDTQVGTDTDGLTTFDLDAVTTALQPGTDLSSLTIDYYSSEFNALNNISPLPRFFNNSTAGQQTIYIKVTNPDGCYVVEEIQLIVKALPPAATLVLTQCDFDFTNDGRTLFSLSEADDTFLNNDPSLSVSYYLNSADAITQQNALTEITNTSNPQNIVARVDSAPTQCFRLNVLTLSVASEIIRERILYECDILQQENGIATFDLSEADFGATAGAEITYYRSAADAALEQNAISDTAAYENEVAYADRLYIRIEDGNSCVGMGLLDLVVSELPNIDPESDGNDYVCSNLPNKYIVIDAGLLEGSPEDFDYLWSLNGKQYGASTYMIAVNQPGTYTVEVVNKNACRKTRTIVVHPSNEAIIEDIAVSDFIVTDNTITISLAPESIGNYEFSLNDPEGPYQSEPMFDNVEAGFHTLYIRDVNGCGVLAQLVTVLGLPRFFTPNGDGTHDTWRIDGLDSSEFRNTTVHIFDRHGKLLKEIATNDTAGWDGTINGQPLPADDYWYVISLFDGRSTKGHFSLKR